MTISRFYPLIIILLGIIAYSNSFHASFFFDDKITIINEPGIRKIIPSSAREALYPRQLVRMTFALNHRLSGLNPADYKAVNIAIHLSNGTLLYLLLALLFANCPARISPHSRDFAFLCALLWTLHPLAGSTVAYISQRFEQMMAMFYIITLYTAFKSRSSSHPRAWQAASCLALFLGASCKEPVITAPLAIIIMDYAFDPESFRRILSARWKFYVLLAIAASRAFPFFADGSIGDMNSKITSDYAILYMLTQCEVFFHYMGLAVYPVNLCLDYYWPLIAGFWEAMPWLIAFMIFIIAGLSALKRNPPAGFAMLFIPLVLLPTSIIPLEDAVFEHRMYLPLAALVALALPFSWVISASIAGKFHKLPSKPLFITAWLLVALLLGTATFNRNPVYKSEETIWRDVISKRPGNLRAYQNLASIAFDKGNDVEALRFLDAVLSELDQYADKDIREIYRNATPSQRYTMGKDILNYSGALNNKALVFLRRGELEQAEIMANRALDTAPYNHLARNTLGSVYFRKGMRKKAMEQWQISLIQKPGVPQTHSLIADAMYLDGQFETAIEHYGKCLEAAPDNPVAALRLARILAGTAVERPDRAERASAIANTILKASGGANANAFEILAAACAAHGDFTAAAKKQAMAIELYANRQHTHEQDFDTDIMDKMIAVLSGYSNNVPFKLEQPGKHLEGKEP